MEPFTHHPARSPIQTVCVLLLALFAAAATAVGAPSSATALGPAEAPTGKTALEVADRKPSTQLAPDVDDPGSPLRECLRNQGLAYGPFRDGQDPGQGTYPTREQIAEDLQFLASVTHRIRSYSVAGSLAEIPAIARELGLAVTQGIYLGDDPAANEAEVSTAVELARQGLVESLVVGNEGLTLSTLSKADLISYLRRVREAVPPEVRVTTAEAWSIWRDNPDLAGEVDFVMAHFHPYWEGQPIEGAAVWVLDRYGELEESLRQAVPDRKLDIVIGETGWPSGGRSGAPGVSDRTVPSGENQRKFVEQFLGLACERSLPFYYFQAFDEEWKWREGSSAVASAMQLPQDRTFSGRWPGSSWGLYRSDGLLKPDLAGLLEQPSPGSRSERDLFVRGQLAGYYDVGVDSSGRRRDWLSRDDDALRLAYPAGQQWGAVFLTVGAPSDPPRPWKDFSSFGFLSLEMKGAQGAESLAIGLKDHDDRDDGREKKLGVSSLTTEWQQFTFPLSDFASSRFSLPASLERLYVAVEFVFDGPRAQTVLVRNVRYLPRR